MVILFDQFNLPENIFEIIFATEQQVIVGKLLVEQMKMSQGEIGKTEMSLFATALHEGKLAETKISYNKRQFYNYYDNAADLLDFLVRHGHPRAKLLLYTSKVLVPGHDGFAATQIWEGDGFVAVVYERRASSPLKSSINNPWLC